MAEDKKNIYGVDRIVDRRIRNGAFQYLVKWTDSWVDGEEQLDNFEDFVKKFKKEKKTKTASKNKRYDVESIVDKRVQYLVKWLDCPHSENTWEPEENLMTSCKNVVEKFELCRAAEKRVKEADSTMVTDKQVRGFDRGLEPERIIGASDSSGQLLYLIKWSGINEADLVASTEANKKCPEAVIKFFEDRLTWHVDDKEK